MLPACPPSCQSACESACPPHGAKGIRGRRARMEDAFTIVPSLIEVNMPAGSDSHQEVLPHGIRVQVNNITGPDGDGITTGHGNPSPAITTPCSCANQLALDTLHFFAVYDGHGGAEAAVFCARVVHVHLADALASEGRCRFSALDVNSSAAACDVAPQGESTSRSAAIASFLSPQFSEGSESEDDDSHAGQAAKQQVNDRPEEASEQSRFEAAFLDVFLKADEEFECSHSSALVGTTAVVALVGNHQLYLGNCGDSRAVLCRGGVAVPLTDDHKATRADEKARVEAAGGQVLFWNGARVLGVLAVTRAIGDHSLRPCVIAQPEVTVIDRHSADELLVLASDGLWDVLTNQEACSLTRRCMRRARQRGASLSAAAHIAATVLTRAAFDRGSRDNITAVVVDLSREEDGSCKALSAQQTNSGSLQEVDDLTPLGQDG